MSSFVIIFEFLGLGGYSFLLFREFGSQYEEFLTPYTIFKYREFGSQYGEFPTSMKQTYLTDYQ